MNRAHLRLVGGVLEKYTTGVLEKYTKTTRHAQLLAEMEPIVPSCAACAHRASVPESRHRRPAASMGGARARASPGHAGPGSHPGGDVSG